MILVVEDDERVRTLTVSRLKMIGYQVVEARDGPEALSVLESGTHVDLVFTDMIMPGGMSGARSSTLPERSSLASKCS